MRPSTFQSVSPWRMRMIRVGMARGARPTRACRGRLSPFLTGNPQSQRVQTDEAGRIALPDGSYLDADDFVTSEGRVDIDIKPGSDPNSINLSSSGVIPVAILSSLVFDATTVDPDTVSLAGSSIKLVGKSGKLLAHQEDVNGDGLTDLVCQVLTDQLLLEPGASAALLEAQTTAGIPIVGQDSIQIVSD